MFDAIGGYFGLEIRQGEIYHKNLPALNSGRNAFEYILRARGYRHIYIPYYTCEVILEPLRKLNIDYDFYNVNEWLEPDILPEIINNSAFLYTNYFGLKTAYIKRLSGIVPNLVIDASQAFFSRPLPGVDTFYSPRKFFGVPDGGYVSCDEKLIDDFPDDISVDRLSHLIKRIDISAEEGYADFKSSDESLSCQPIKKMSKLTKSLLKNIDYEACLKKRNDNFRFLHGKIHEKNRFRWLDDDIISGPMIYPFFSTEPGLREKLIQHKIYVAKYWPNLDNCVNNDSCEHKLYEYLLPLPIDQRYCEMEMKKIIDIING